VLALALLLLFVGLVVLRAMDEADAAFQRSEIDFGSHVSKLVVAAPALVLGLLVRPRWLRRNSLAIYSACLVLLALVPFIGQERNNARRWIQLPVGFDLQPSELAKLGVILALARVLYRSRLARPVEWLPPLAIALTPMAMVALQPDLGTALTLAPISMGMFWLAGARARVLILAVAAGAALAFSAWHFEWVKSYQLQRVDTWVHSWEPAELIEGRNGPAFHSYHARTAIGNGWWVGTGLGRGVANEAGHLPERSSDSIFAVVAEEAGLLGAGGLVVLYSLMIVLLLGSASTLRERFSRLVVGGIALYFASHFFVNVGVNLGLLPMTGLTLPLLSTGGSSLLVTFAALGLALGLAAHREPSLDRDAFRL
jgi:rod shape determining protein RodA